MKKLFGLFQLEDARSWGKSNSFFIGAHRQKVLAPGGRGCAKKLMRDSEGLSRSGGSRGAGDS